MLQWGRDDGQRLAAIVRSRCRPRPSSATVCINSVDYGIETAVDNGVPQQLAVTTACLDDGLPYMNAFLIEVGTEVSPQPDANLEFFNVPAAGCCNAETQSMSIKLEAPVDCIEEGCQSLFIGVNSLGQIAPSYIEAEDCNVFDPLDLAAIGFADIHTVMIINGDGTDGNGGADGGGIDGGGDDAVPAVGGFLPLAFPDIADDVERVLPSTPVRGIRGSDDEKQHRTSHLPPHRPDALPAGDLLVAGGGGRSGLARHPRLAGAAGG